MSTEIKFFVDVRNDAGFLILRPGHFDTYEEAEKFIESVKSEHKKHLLYCSINKVFIKRHTEASDESNECAK